jgi:hypothetical protein
MGWLGPLEIALGIGIIALGVIAGRVRRETPFVVALNTAGTLIFLGGIRWAMSLGDEAVGPVFAASLGAILFTMGSERHRSATARAQGN